MTEEATVVKFNHYLIAGGNSWAKETDLFTCFWSWFKREHPRSDTTISIYQVDEDAYVNEMGTLYADRQSKKLGVVNVSKAFIKKQMDVEDSLDELLAEADSEFDFDLMYPKDDAA